MCSCIQAKQTIFFSLPKIAVFITKAETSLFIQDISPEKCRGILRPLVIRCITKIQLTPAVTKLILLVHIVWDSAYRWLCVITTHSCKCWRPGWRHVAQGSLFWLWVSLTGSLWGQEECSGYGQPKEEKVKAEKERIMSKTKQKAGFKISDIYITGKIYIYDRIQVNFTKTKSTIC